MSFAATEITQSFPEVQVKTATEPATAQSSTAPKLYPLDQKEAEVPIVSRGQKLYHRLTLPTLAQLVEREAQSTYETESVSDSEERISADDETANARLWNQVAVAVKGYKLNKADTTPLSEWCDMTDELRDAIPATHKATAIRALYQFNCEVEKDEEEGFTLGADTWTVKQTFGDADDPDYVVRHILRTPTEAERREFKRKANDVRFSKGQRRLKTKVVTHLKAHVELYDALFQRIDGATFNGQGFSEHTYGLIENVTDQPAHPKPTAAQLYAPLLAAIDPIWKRSVIDTLMRSFEAATQD